MFFLVPKYHLRLQKYKNSYNDQINIKHTHIEVDILF